MPSAPAKAGGMSFLAPFVIARIPFVITRIPFVITRIPFVITRLDRVTHANCISTGLIRKWHGCLPAQA